MMNKTSPCHVTNEASHRHAPKKAWII